MFGLCVREEREVDVVQSNERAGLKGTIAVLWMLGGGGRNMVSLVEVFPVCEPRRRDSCYRVGMKKSGS